MAKGTLSSGFEYEIPDAALDDMELLDALEELEENPAKVSRILLILLGKEQRSRLYEHLRKDGRVSVTDVTSCIAEIFDHLGQTGKN